MSLQEEACRPSPGNVTLIGELFNLQMVEEANNAVSLQKDQHEERLGCLCKLL